MTTPCRYTLFGLPFEAPTLKAAWSHFIDVMEVLGLESKLGKYATDPPGQWPVGKDRLQGYAGEVAGILGLPTHTFTVVSFGDQT
ncbi:MAG: hypothetical protein OXQ94_18820 [Gemmatimonadota bacterium]|nr:hypothetical protein [Gemmatimonadota bacterium]MDE2873726.1 hypothetical protein [Gemmatimonadota bacterium]